MTLDPLAPFRLDGQVALLTGASSGLGMRFAHVLHGLGATVVLTARRADRLEALADELDAASPGRAIVIPGDVGEPGANEAFVAAAVERTGSLDVVVANAGIANSMPAIRETPEDFVNVVNIDLVAPFVLARAAATYWRQQKRGGSVVMVASTAGLTSESLLPQAGYVAAKTGLLGLTRELAVQWARYNIRVNALCPGMFPSEMTSEVTDNPDIQAAFENAIPLKRLGATHELDGALAFLAGGGSSYMTGQSIVVDGGLHS